MIVVKNGQTLWGHETPKCAYPKFELIKWAD